MTVKNCIGMVKKDEESPAIRHSDIFPSLFVPMRIRVMRKSHPISHRLGYNIVATGLSQADIALSATPAFTPMLKISPLVQRL